MMQKLEVRRLRRMVVVNCVECSTEFERENKSGEPIISCMEVKEKGFSRVMFAIS